MAQLPTLEEYLQADKYGRGRIRRQYRAEGLHPPHAGFGRTNALKDKHYPPEHAQHQPRPYRYHFKDDRLREQHWAYNKMKAQAAFRREAWALNLEDFFDVWHSQWCNRGRGINNVVLARIDPERPWHKLNVEIITRQDHIARVAALRKGQPRKCK